VVDVVQEQRKAREEQERGDKEKHGHRSDYMMKLPAIKPRGMECTDLCSLEWTMPPLGRLVARLSPLLYKYHQKSTGKSYNQAQEPKRVCQDCASWRRKFRWVYAYGKGAWLGTRSGGIGELMVNIYEIGS